MADINVLLVEGTDDKHVFYSLLKHYSIPEIIKVKDKAGIENIIQTLDVELDASGLENLGIVVDADIDIKARWDSIRNRLIKCGYTSVPLEPDAEGTIILEDQKPRVGVWVMPDNKIPGMLEHFVEFLIPETDVLWGYAQSCVDSILNDQRPFGGDHIQKAYVHTWLAWREKPGVPFGTAITARYLNADAIHATRLIAWLRNLYNVS